LSFSLNTNITSLQAQTSLRMGANFQAKTINRVTSGLRIVNSGDDAAGLAIANGLRSDQAVMTQGIRNANDGLSTLQTIDGGVNNIAGLLDRAATLATQSASGTFTGDRDVLNNEFQSVMQEVDRQAQAIGLDSGGKFARDMSVFIGGGRTNGSVSNIANGAVNLDLSNSTVDTRSLGLKGLQATGNTSVDIGVGSVSTSVSSIVNDATNQASETVAGYSTFYFSGPGFSNNTGSTRVAISVNMAGVTDANTLATAVNSAIEATGNGASQQATAFKNAGIKASIVTDDNGSHLAFTSPNSAFQVSAGDRTANALLGNISSGATGASVQATTSTDNNTAAVAATANANQNNVKINVKLGGSEFTATLNIANADTRATMVSNLNDALTAAGAEVTAKLNGSNELYFEANNTAQAESLSVGVSGDTRGFLGVGTFQTGAGNAYEYSTLTAGAAQVAGETQHIQIAIGDQVADLGVLTAGATEAESLTTLNTAIQSNAVLKAAGIVAQDDGAGNIQLVSNGTEFRVNSYAASGTGVGFGFANAVGGADSSDLGQLSGSYASAPTAAANGASTSGFLNFHGITVSGVSQTLTVTAPDAGGTVHAKSFSLSSSNSSDIDSALSYINTQILQSNDSTLQKIVAVKEQSGGVEGIRFVSSNSNFNVSLGTTATGTAAASDIQGLSNGTGVASQGGPVVASSQLGSGSTADISSETNAKNAITALSNAVSALGQAQAVVGKGQNRINYAINLAQSQITNSAAAESRIRDADLAAEAANLSKAQILVQAGTAALAQANSAPQAVLSLLRG
jgi:flagellin